MSLEGEDEDNPILSFKTTRKSNRNNISSIYNEQEMMIPWSDRRYEIMRYIDDNGSRTMQRRRRWQVKSTTMQGHRQRQIEDDAEAQTTMDRRRCGGADDDRRWYGGETENTDGDTKKTNGDTEKTAQLCRKRLQNLLNFFQNVFLLLFNN